MQQLLNLNVEGEKHVSDVLDLLDRREPTVVCLQEAPESFVALLEQRNYQVTFVPLTLRQAADQTTRPEGLLFASRDHHTADIQYYHETGQELLPFNFDRYRDTWRLAVILAEIDGLHVATTHFTWTPDGATPNDYQQEDIVALCDVLDTFPPHVLCGDLNLPRHHNRLYEEYLLPPLY